MPRKKKTERVEVVDLVPSGAERNALAQSIDEDALYQPEVTNSKLAAFTYKVMQISKKADPTNVGTLYDCFNEYLALCSETNMKVTNMMAYCSCRLSKQTIDHWVSGKAYSNSPQYKEFALYVKAVCSASREQLANEGKINPVFAIWQQKVHDGFRDNEIISIAEERERNKTSAEIMKDFADL